MINSSKTMQIQQKAVPIGTRSYQLHGGTAQVNWNSSIPCIFWPDTLLVILLFFKFNTIRMKSILVRCYSLEIFALFIFEQTRDTEILNINT